MLYFLGTQNKVEKLTLLCLSHKTQTSAPLKGGGINVIEMQLYTI